MRLHHCTHHRRQGSNRDGRNFCSKRSPLARTDRSLIGCWPSCWQRRNCLPMLLSGSPVRGVSKGALASSYAEIWGRIFVRVPVAMQLGGTFRSFFLQKMKTIGAKAPNTYIIALRIEWGRSEQVLICARTVGGSIGLWYRSPWCRLCRWRSH